MLVGVRGESIKEKLRIQSVHSVEPNSQAAEQEEATDAQSPQALNLAVTAGKPRRGWSEGPGNSGQGHEVGNEVGQGMETVRNQCLRVEDVAPYALANGHAQIDKQPDPCDSHPGIIFIFRRQVSRVVAVSVAVAMGVSCMTSRLGLGL